MISEDLQRKNASLRDKIQEVLQMHPELHDLTEDIAVRQDLHVQVGASFLERTRDKLQERARAIIQRRPELGDYFDGFTIRRAQGRRFGGQRASSR